MGLLSKLKSMLGLESSERAPGSGVDVTVEREPGDDTDAPADDHGDESPGDEPAAAGTDAAASTESLVDEAGTDDPDRAAEPAEAAGSAAGEAVEDDEYVATDADVGAETEEESAAESDGDEDAAAEPEPDDLTEIKGVGPAYADRLHDAGVTTFAALADADPDELAAATDLSPKRVGRWIDRAGDR